MSLKHIDITSVLRRLADRRIEDAMKEGKFDKLAGAGKPLDLEPTPAEENARLLWWTLRILRNNDFVPDEIQWRKSIELLKAQVSQTRDETRLRLLITQINAMVLKLNTLGTNALNSGVAGLDVEVELSRLRARCTS